MPLHTSSQSLLVTPVELAAQLDDPNLLLVDCRFNLLKPAAGRASWAAGHIPGAYYADLDQDLADPVGPDSGRHPLPAPERLRRLFGSWGLNAASRVVAYDDAGGAIAARLWWLLRWSGHTGASLLDGGYGAWLAANLPVSQEQPAPRSGRDPVTTGHWPVISTAQVEAGLRTRRLTLFDARDPARYAGAKEPIDSQAGHIPGALNWPFSDNLDSSGVFRSPADLRAAFRARLKETKGTAAGGLAVMCGSGVTACHTLFAMELAGLFADLNEKPALYCGSWSEWIRSDQRPIATGAEP